MITDLANNDAADFSDELADNDTSLAGVCIAFTDVWNEPNPVWTRIDDPNGINIVDNWSTDFGRASEVDKTKNGSFKINLIDRNGVLDPTNSHSPILDLGMDASIDPMRQIAINVKHQINGQWYSRTRGFIDAITIELDEAENVFRGTIECVGLFSVMASSEVVPDSGRPVGSGGTGSQVLPPTDSQGDVFYEDGEVDLRIRAGFADAGIDASRTVVFSGNVDVMETVYAVRSTHLQIIQDAADAEFPGVANVYEDRFGRGVFHGRKAKFNPSSVAMEAGHEAWDFHHWKAGDYAKWSTDSTYIPIKSLEFSRGMEFVINATLCSPQHILDGDIEGQLSADTTSIATYGERSASWENLLTAGGKDDGLNANQETKLFSDYYSKSDGTGNYSHPRNRVTTITFGNLRPGHPCTNVWWDFLTQADISDQIDVVTTHPGGGGFNETFFIEGIRVTGNKLRSDDYHLFTVELDLSPAAYFTQNPFS